MNSLLGVPSEAKFYVETYPDTEFDLSKMRVWTDGKIGRIEVQHVRMTGVFGATDGSLAQTGRGTHSDVMSIANELKMIGYWDLEPKCEGERSESWWSLAATDGLRTHCVERYGESNEIRTVCERCNDLIDRDALESNAFRVS